MTKPVLIKPELQEDDTAEKESDKTEPRPPDDDGGDEVEAEFYPDDDKPLCTWSNDPDEHRRVFVFDRLADGQVAGNILVENMHAVCEWLRTGIPPQKKAKLERVKE